MTSVKASKIAFWCTTDLIIILFYAFKYAYFLLKEYSNV